MTVISSGRSEFEEAVVISCIISVVCLGLKTAVY